MVQTINKTALIALFLLVATAGCTKKELELRTGGFSRTQRTDTPQNMMLTRVRLMEYLFTDGKGNKWDNADGPDIFFTIRKGSQTLFKSGIVYNVLPVQFKSDKNDTIPAMWRLTQPLEFKNYLQDSTQYWIYFYDRDDTGDQFMFRNNFWLYYFNEYPGYSGRGIDANGKYLEGVSFGMDRKLY